MSKKLEISLKRANNDLVSLKSLSPEALDSFMTVMSSLKNLALSVASADEINFKISEGSALGVVELPQKKMPLLYKELDTAIKGNCEDKIFTASLRNIQEQVQRPAFEFNFLYYDNADKRPIEIHQRLINSKRISTKRHRSKYQYKPKILSGYLNQIGGKDPNYHFDYGGGNKITIDCTKEDATKIKQYLYKDVYSLLICKESNKIDKKDKYIHKEIIEKEYAKAFNNYLRTYNQETDIVEKLTITHEFINSQFSNKNDGKKYIYYLIKLFNDSNYYLSELKTLLVISKPFKEDDLIGPERNLLLKTYTEKREKA